MSNRLVHTAKGYIQSLFRDFKWMYTRERDWVLDLKRLLTQIDSRGVIVLLEDLPAINKHFNLCLDGGTYAQSKLLLSRSKKGEGVPAWCRELFLRVFHPDGSLLADPDTDAIFYLKTLFASGKTICLPCKPEDIENEVSNFFSVDAKLPSPTLQWDSGDPDELWGFKDPHKRSRELSCENYRDPSGFFGTHDTNVGSSSLRLTQECFDILASQFGPAPHLRVDDPDSDPKPRHGPGVVAYLPKGVSKYRFPHWASKLQSFFPYDQFALPNFGWAADCGSGTEPLDSSFNEEIPSRMIAVPKTLKKPRLIAAEPIEHQWIQQLVWRTLEDSVKGTPLARSIDFRDQACNANLALWASYDGSYATVDLSEASDRLTTRLVERFWRSNPDWINSLWACRSRVIRYTGKWKTSLTRMKKFAPMGSSVTFPLQTIIFSALCVSAVHIAQKRRPSVESIKQACTRFRVFGDDIIIETPFLSILKDLLGHFDLKVNVAKTFSNGKFRESCGIEAYGGDDVTPARLRSLVVKGPAGAASMVEVSNNYYRKGLWNASAFLRSLVSKWDFLIPVTDSDRFGIFHYSYCGEETTHLRRRWNADHQRDEIRILTTRVKSVEGEMSPRERLMQYFTESPEPTTKWASGFTLSRTMISRPGWVAL